MISLLFRHVVAFVRRTQELGARVVPDVPPPAVVLARKFLTLYTPLTAPAPSFYRVLHVAQAAWNVVETKGHPDHRAVAGLYYELDSRLRDAGVPVEKLEAARSAIVSRMHREVYAPWVADRT